MSKHGTKREEKIDWPEIPKDFKEFKTKNKNKIKKLVQLRKQPSKKRKLRGMFHFFRIFLINENETLKLFFVDIIITNI